MESNSSALHDKEKQNFLVEVSNSEKQLWALINSKGLLQPEVQNLYRRICSSYESIILRTSKSVNLQEVEYSLWKLHYKHIDEFRRQIKRGSSSSSGHVEGLRLFLGDATEFYKSLLLKLRSQSTPKDCIEKKENAQFLSHRILICLGDLARYRELFEKPEVEARDWSIAAGHYLEASRTWPDSGNPHNQLALLATYIGDEFLALYHCVRSLAIKEPFPDAWNNLVLLLEKSRPPVLSSGSCEAFDFLKPSERSKFMGNTWKPEISADGWSDSGKNKLWPLIVRMTSFFYMKSSLDDFRNTFASTIKELEILMDLDDTQLKEALKSYQFTDSTNVGPTRAVQAVCTFIFIVENLPKNPLLRHSEEKNGTNHQLLLRQYVVSSAFIFMGRLIERCVKAHLVNSCPLLPSVLVFMEWLMNVFDELGLHGRSEEGRAAVSYFFGNLVRLLNSLRAGKAVQDRAALWEDYELQGFAPLAKSHLSLDFSSSSAQSKSFQSGSSCRVRRILFAARKIAERSLKWILYDKSSSKFSAVTKGEEKSVSADEEEVILFKPLTRHNSAPLYKRINSKDHLLDEEDLDDAIVPPEECLRRTQTAREIKPFKQPELAISAGPPSLSAWVLNGGSSGISLENRLSPIEELASTSMANLSITTSTQENPVPESVHEAVITHYPSPPPLPPYSAPIPSAPLLPEDASWFTGAQPSYDDGTKDRSSGAFYGGPGDFINFTPHSPAGFANIAYPVYCGLSSSEWLRKFREINSLHPGNSQGWTPTNLLGNFSALAGPQWGNQVPLGSNQTVYLSPKPPLQPEYPQRPIPFGCGGVVPDPVRGDQSSLLQYLKEREWRLQQDPSRQGPTFLGN